MKIIFILLLIVILFGCVGFVILKYENEPLQTKVNIYTSTTTDTTIQSLPIITTKQPIEYFPKFYRVHIGIDDPPVLDSANDIFSRQANQDNISTTEYGQRIRDDIEKLVEEMCPNVDEKKKWDFIYEKYYHTLMRAYYRDYSHSRPTSSESEKKEYMMENVPYEVENTDLIWSKTPSCALPSATTQQP